MAHPDDVDSRITLELAGGATTDDFRQVVAAFDGLLKAVTKGVCRDEAALQWIVRPKPGSILLGVDAAPSANARGAREVEALFSAVLAVRAPSHQYESVVPHIRVLARMPETHLWIGRERTAITRELHSQMQAVLRPSHRLHGSVEGRLTTLSERRGLAIREPVWDARIECSVREDQLDAMRSLWRKRVRARGVVHYRPDGFPTKIEAESVEPFPDDAELPTHHDVLGILRGGCGICSA